MFVACSTLCFSRQSLTVALRTIGELGFTKVDLAIQESGAHLTPNQVASDFARIAQTLKSAGGLAVTAIHADFGLGTAREVVAEQLRAVCRLARVLTTPLISIPAAPVGTDLGGEVERLTWIVRLTQAEGVALAVETRLGTLTDDPAVALLLCKRVPDLGIALDPSAYLVGPNPTQELDDLFPYVQHVRLRDTSSKNGQFQVRIGQGEIEYGRIVTQLARCRYQRTLSVDIHDAPATEYEMQPEVRKLKYLLESLI